MWRRILFYNAVLVDLAAGITDGVRMEESKNFNRSLTYLNTVIKASLPLNHDQGEG